MLLEIPRYKIAPIMDMLQEGQLVAAGVTGVPFMLSDNGAPFFNGGRPPEVPVAVTLVDGKFFWDIDDEYAANPPLYGRPFIHKTFDCYQFLRDYYHAIYNVALPELSYEDDWWVSGSNHYLDNALTAGFSPVEPPLQPGDVILMRVMSPVANHAAVYVGEGNIAHHMGGKRSCIEPFRRAFLRDVAGYYRHQELV